MVLSGAINKELVSWIGQAGGRAVGISGKDGGFVTATKVRRTQRDPDSNIERIVDLGFVGEPSHIDRSLLDTISAAGMIPVVAPKIGRAHVCTPVTNAHLVCRLLLAKKK